MAAHGKVGEFVPSQDTWDVYIEQLDLYFKANGITDAKKKRPVLLTVCGPATYKLIQNLVAPKKTAEVEYADIVKLVQDHLTPKPTVIVQRFKFHTRKQRPGEPVAAFVAEFRHLTEHCDFGATLDDMLRDRLICGIADIIIQRRLLAEDELILLVSQNAFPANTFSVVSKRVLRL